MTMTATKDITVWGIHAGRTGDADTLFLKKHVVAIGWEAMGDLAALAPDREAFKAQAQKAYPDAKRCHPTHRRPELPFRARGSGRRPHRLPVKER